MLQSDEDEDQENESSDDDDMKQKDGRSSQSSRRLVESNKIQANGNNSGSQLRLLDESIAIAQSSSSSSSSSSDDSFTSPTTSKKNIVPASHFCTYFQRDSGEPLQQSSGCKHAVVIGQNVCLKCEFGRGVNDSLDHMAFLSPEKSTQSTQGVMKKDKYGFEVVEIQGYV